MKNPVQWDIETIGRLKELGLTEYDAKIYCTLVARSPRTAIDLSREADVPMSKIYVSLSRLENGGWISVVPERPKQYRAVDPSVTVDRACGQAVDRLESTKSLLRKSLKETYDRRGADETEAAEFLVVHGTVNALNHLKEIVQSQEAGISVIAAFVSPRTAGRINDLLSGYGGPKRLYVINDKEGMGPFAGLLQLPYVVPLEAGERWHEGIVFLYTEGAGMYATVEGDDFRMALVIRDRGLLGLMKSFVEGSHHQMIKLGPESADMHAKFATHTAMAREKLDRLVHKHK